MILKLGPYLAGLIEGDGLINVPSVLRDSKNIKRYVSIRICFNYNDIKLAEYLQTILGGNFRINKTKNYIIYSILKLDEIIELAQLINGYMRTPKIEALRRLFNFLNENYNMSLVIKELDDSPLESNSWLSGFTDAHGNFNINISKRKGNSIRIKICFRIEQRQLYKELQYQSYFEICQKIAKYFLVSLYSRVKKSNSKEYLAYLIVAHNSQSHFKVCNYFDKYPLLSSKYLNYKDWCEIHYIQTKKEYLTPEGYKKSFSIKNRFNNRKRLLINWDHLLLNINKLLIA